MLVECQGWGRESSRARGPGSRRTSRADAHAGGPRPSRSCHGRRDAEAPAWEAAHPGVVADKAGFAPIAAALAGVTGPVIARVTGMSDSYVAEVRLGG